MNRRFYINQLSVTTIAVVIFCITIVTVGLTSTMLATPTVKGSGICDDCTLKVVFVGAGRPNVTLEGKGPGWTIYEPFTSMFSDPNSGGTIEYYNLTGRYDFKATFNGTEKTSSATLGGAQQTLTFDFSVSAPTTPTTTTTTETQGGTSQAAIQNIVRESNKRLESPLPPLELSKELSAKANQELKTTGFFIQKRSDDSTDKAIAIVVEKVSAGVGAAPTRYYLQGDGSLGMHEEWRAWYKWGFDYMPSGETTADSTTRLMYLSSKVPTGTYNVSLKACPEMSSDYTSCLSGNESALSQSYTFEYSK